jgi:hypothetical protein
MERVQPVAERRVRLRVQVAVAVEGEADRGVTGPGGDLLEAGAGGEPQGDGCRDEQRALKLPSGVPVTRNIRTAYAGDQPVEVMDTISNGEAVSYRFEIQV